MYPLYVAIPLPSELRARMSQQKGDFNLTHKYSHHGRSYFYRIWQSTPKVARLTLLALGGFLLGLSRFVLENVSS